MTTTDILDRPAPSRNGRKPAAGTSTDGDHAAYVQRWLNTWIALGTLVLLVVAGYLFFISNALVSINHNLATASVAVAGAEGNTKTLPGQLHTVNQNLGAVAAALRDLPSQTGSVEQSLRTVDTNLAPTVTSLRSTAADLTDVSHDLRGTASKLGGVSSGLADTSRLLAMVLGTTGSVDASLTAINTSHTGGIAQLAAGTGQLNAALAGTSHELGDVDTTLVAVNQQLTDICNASVVNLLHGRQPC